MEVEILNENLTVRQPRMRVESTHNLLLAQRPRTNLGETSNKNLSDELVRSVQELAKSVIETSSKVRELKIYNEAINNPINRNRWQEV